MNYILLSILLATSCIVNDCWTKKNRGSNKVGQDDYNFEELASTFVADILLKNPSDFFNIDDYFESDIYNITNGINSNLFVIDSICAYSSLSSFCSEYEVAHRKIFGCYNYLSSTYSLERMSFEEFSSSTKNVFLIAPLKPLICQGRKLIEVRLYSSSTELRDYVFTIEVVNEQLKLVSTGITSSANRWTK